MGPAIIFEELFKNGDQRKRWSRFVRGESPMEWESVYAGYEAVVDFPSSAYYQEIAETFPDALVILSLRELERWSASWQSLWRYFPYFQSAPLRWLFPRVDEIADVLEIAGVERVFHGRMEPASMIKTHEEHIARVKQVISPERLLVYRVQEGWEPLCQALDLPVSDMPFPRHHSGSWPFVKRGVGKMFGRGWTNLSTGR
jgi:hypothetical protein